MCGICGIVNFRADALPQAAHAQVAAMLYAMAHRGPDGDAYSTHRRVIMASNRLAIRAVTEPQPPLFEVRAGVVVACNGEIDNHRELRRALVARGYQHLSASDVAVIAPLYLEHGWDCLDKLSGAFAFALWDPRSQRLALGRDRAGERHLYYTLLGGRVAFASELAALLRALPTPPGLNLAELAHYLRSGYSRAPATALNGICKVAPGQVVVIDAGGIHARRYWHLPNRVRCAPPSGEAFDSTLRAAVLRQSAVDGEYGVLLSGGVDSALIAALLRDLRPAKRLRAYSIRFAEASYDEGGAAQRVTRQLGCEFVPVNVTAADFPNHLRALVAATGELIADPAWIPISKAAERASQDIKTLFGGEGADELFGGYPTYLGARWAPRFARLPRPLRAPVELLIHAWPVTDKKMSVSFMLKRFIREAPDGLARHLLWTAGIDPERLRRLGFQPPCDDVTRAEDPLLDDVQRYDFTHLLPEAYLTKADRGAMLHGVELRAPFLDREVVETAAALPVEARVRGLATKVFLKHYALRYLPAGVVNQRKRGLSVPLARWLRGPLYAWARAHLAGSELASIGINSAESMVLLTEHARHKEDHARAIWTLIVLSTWLQWRRQRLALVPDTSARDRIARFTEPACGLNRGWRAVAAGGVAAP